MSEINMHSTVHMPTEQIIVFFYNYCKVMAVPITSLSKILDYELMKIKEGTLFTAKFSASQTDSTLKIQLGESSRELVHEKWNKQMAQYLSTVALKDDANGEGFAGRTHIYLTNNMDAHAIDITLKIKFNKKAGAKLSLLLKHENI